MNNFNYQQYFVDNNSPLTILGIDPGTDNVGVAIINYDLSNRCIINTDSTTIRGSDLIRFDSLVEVHGSRNRRLVAIGNLLLKMLIHYQPTIVACEFPFFNTSRPSAFSALIESVEAIKSALFKYDNNMSLMLVDPPNVKKAFGVSGAADKATMLSAYNSLFHELKPINRTIDEHSIDAIAVAKWVVNTL